MKYKLDMEESLDDFEDWAFLLFHTSAPVHLFADSLNQLYDCRLTRIDNLVVADAEWPFFQHDDPVRHLKYFLAERPASAVAAPWEPGDKLLAIKGESAAYVAEDIYADFTEPANVDPADLLARQHADLIDELLAGFTMVSLLNLDSEPPKRSAAAKQRLLVSQFCSDMLEYIDTHHLDLTEDERRLLPEARTMSD
ncbi:MAG: hypothetical protein J6V98_02805 [Bacteroidales bacterium]|nr:hypothetical protein [Bacteroidales bacterium]